MNYTLIIHTINFIYNSYKLSMETKTKSDLIDFTVKCISDKKYKDTGVEIDEKNENITL